MTRAINSFSVILVLCCSVLLASAVKVKLTFHNAQDCSDTEVTDAVMTTEDCLSASNGLRQKVNLILIERFLIEVVI